MGTWAELALQEMVHVAWALVGNRDSPEKTAPQSRSDNHEPYKCLEVRMRGQGSERGFWRQGLQAQGPNTCLGGLCLLEEKEHEDKAELPFLSQLPEALASSWLGAVAGLPFFLLPSALACTEVQKETTSQRSQGREGLL